MRRRVLIAWNWVVGDVAKKQEKDGGGRAREGTVVITGGSTRAAGVHWVIISTGCPKEDQNNLTYCDSGARRRVKHASLAGARRFWIPSSASRGSFFWRGQEQNVLAGHSRMSIVGVRLGPLVLFFVVVSAVCGCRTRLGNTIEFGRTVPWAARGGGRL